MSWFVSDRKVWNVSWESASFFICFFFYIIPVSPVASNVSLWIQKSFSLSALPFICPNHFIAKSCLIHFSWTVFVFPSTYCVSDGCVTGIECKYIEFRSFTSFSKPQRPPQTLSLGSIFPQHVYLTDVPVVGGRVKFRPSAHRSNWWKTEKPC